jgi:hypothetical protein
MLTDEDVRTFVEDGFVRLPGAVPRATVDQCRAELWEASGCDAADPSTWTKPVIRIGGLATPPFREAANTQALREAYDQLAGRGRWNRPLGLGTFPLRFPSDEAPGDDGWHLDAGFAGDGGEGRVNVRSRGRALLMLFLFSDVGPDDAPTRIRVGSHLDVPALLADAGDDGREWFALCQDAVPVSAGRREVAATGRAGDVYLCHPFLVHAAQRHHGRVPRLLAQPPLEPAGLLDLTGASPTPVEQAVLMGLPRVYEIRIRGCGSTDEALALQGPVARVVCPDEGHEPPCEVPWGFGFAEDGLVLGVYCSRGKAEELAGLVRGVVGAGRPVVVGEGDTERFGELEEQYLIENGSRPV